MCPLCIHTYPVCFRKFFLNSLDLKTIVKDLETQALIQDFTVAGQRHEVAKGGRGVSLQPPAAQRSGS